MGVKARRGTSPTRRALLCVHLDSPEENRPLIPLSCPLPRVQWAIMSIPTISLFSGCGGLDEGAEEAGATIRVAVEWDETAAASLSQNLPEGTPIMSGVKGDITRLSAAEILERAGLESGEPVLLIGGPPCTPFSKSGYWLDYKREGRDPDASLLQDYSRVLAETQPLAFVLENVFGLAYRNRRPILGRLLREIEQAGYVHNIDMKNVAASVVNAADYGVPQLRQRLFIVGIRKDMAGCHVPSLPSPTHSGPHERQLEYDRTLIPHVTAGIVLASLVDRDDLAEPGESVNGKWGHLLPGIPPGENYLYYSERGAGEHIFDWRSRYWTFLLKLDPDRPSSTIQANPGPYVGPFHWENRRLRVPELLRLMTFPDGYRLEGDRRLIQRQLGNAVPPLLARQVVAHLLHHLP